MNMQRLLCQLTCSALFCSAMDLDREFALAFSLPTCLKEGIARPKSVDVEKGQSLVPCSSLMLLFFYTRHGKLQSVQSTCVHQSTSHMLSTQHHDGWSLT